MQALRFLLDELRSLRRDQRGNIAIMFGLSIVPMLLLMGGAIDVARFHRYRTELANSVDAAALALAREGPNYSDAQATTFVNNYVAALGLSDDQFSVTSLSAAKTDGGFRITADGTMQTMFLPLGQLTEAKSGLMSMGMNIVSEVQQSSNRVELALVFDNTGSMDDYAGSNTCDSHTTRMAGLQCAATTLVTKLHAQITNTADADLLKIALVPFEGAVNVGVDTSSPPSWIEWSNESSVSDSNQPYYTGRNFSTKNFGSSWSPNYKRIGPRWLYEKLGISWAGCVEMRAEPYDTTDTAPDTSNPDTLWVPMFWPDEPDTSWDYWNNYLNDGVSGSDSSRQASLTKYDKSSPSYVSWQWNKKDTTFPYSSGPNRGCPTPIVPLTTDKQTIIDAIDDMQAYGATGTFIPAGLAWGWRVLSPGEPFTQGIGPNDEFYDKTVKAMILLSDGANSPSISQTGWSNINGATYSAYNYPDLAVDKNVNGTHYYRRLQEPGTNSNPSDSTATGILDDKTSTLCTNAKGDGIRIYTITFGSMTTAATDLMKGCASKDKDGEPLYYSAPSSSDLETIFNQIGEDLSEIHLSM